jgi:GT2 family glycosyltransferase
MERGGSAFFFDYPGLPLGRPVTPASFYTCSVAVSRQLLETTHGFDEGFPYASHEDLELGLRLGRQGMRLWYEPDLCAFHWHPLTLASASDRVRRMGRSAWMYWGRVEDGSPHWRRLARRLLSLLSRTPGLNAWRRVLLARLSDTRPEQAKGWWLLMQLSFWIGYGEARHVLSSEKKKPRDCMSDPLC